MKPTSTHKLTNALLGLACACAIGLPTSAQAQITGTNEIALSDFDSTIPSFDYGYFYSDGNIGGTFTTDRFYPEPPENTNNVFRYTFDTTVFAGFSSWWGTGFGMPLNWSFDPALFTSVDLQDYILSWDARVEGLNPGQTTANCTMEFRLGPDGSRVLQKNIDYNPGSNWTHFVVTLDQGNYGDGTSYTTFTNGVAAGVAAIAFNQNQNAPTQFGADADNAIYMNNIKLEVRQYAGPPPPPPPTVPTTIVNWNFDDQPFWWGSGGWGWSATVNPSGAYSFGTNAAGDLGAVNDLGVGGSSGWALWMTNSQFIGNVPAWCGIGMNGGAGGDFAQFTSSDLKNYQFTVNVRGGGFADGATEASMNVKLFLRAPDDTLQPPDANSDADDIVTLVWPVTVTSNWQTFTSTLNAGGASDGTSKANFALHYNTINGAMAQVQVENLQNEIMWAYDSDNVVYLDNYRVERLDVGLVPLTIQQLGNNQVITWPAPPTGSTKLLSGISLTTVTNEVVGATSPYTNALPGVTRYFRTQWIAP